MWHMFSLFLRGVKRGPVCSILFIILGIKPVLLYLSHYPRVSHPVVGDDLGIWNHQEAASLQHVSSSSYILSTRICSFSTFKLWNYRHRKDFTDHLIPALHVKQRSLIFYMIYIESGDLCSMRSIIWSLKNVIFKVISIVQCVLSGNF